MNTPSEADRSGEAEIFAGNETRNVEQPGEKAEDQPKQQRTFGSLSPQEAGRRSAQARRERARHQEAEALEQSSGKVVVVRTPVQVGHIIARLAVDAKKGNTQAARELREWMRQYPADDETDVSALDERTRQQVLARVLAEIVEEEGSLPDAPLDP